jgi:hypothetical protein
MYRNIGNKIKILAIGICVAFAILTIVYGFLLVLTENSSQQTRMVGLLIIIIGPIVCWVNSFILYGFGELVQQNIEANYAIQFLVERLNEEQKEDEILKAKIMDDQEEKEDSFYNPINE